MSNTYFAFKQFRIEQDACAMKVSTDGCIQGAWAPLPENATEVLDIGAGTGLLSLMLAQRYPGIMITALEIDNAAAEQANANIAASPFSDRIQLLQQDAKVFNPASYYDFIICNPPFFKQSLLGPDDARNAARHHFSLTPEDLIELLKRVLAPMGMACFMWPEKEHRDWERLMSLNRFYPHQVLSIRDRAGAKITRLISIWGREEPLSIVNETLVIKEADGQYTDAFRALLAPFYLHL